MAAVDLTGLNFANGGASDTQSAGTTWQEFKIPKWAKLVTIQPIGQAIYFSYNATDGASVGANRFPQAVSSIVQYNPMQTSGTRSIFIAAQTGTATIHFLFE